MIAPPRRAASRTATRRATGWPRSCRCAPSCSRAGRTPPGWCGWPAPSGSTRGRSGARLDARGAALARLGRCTSSSTPTSGTTPSTGAGSRSSASARAQLDMYGNANNSVDRRPTTTRRRCACPAPPGSATWARSASASSTGTPTTTRGRSSSSVDFVSCAGYLGGGDERAAARPRGRARSWWSRNLAVLDFEPESKRMRLRRRAPRRDRRARCRRRPASSCSSPDGEVPETAAPTARAGAADPRGDRPRRACASASSHALRQRAMDIELGAPGADHAARPTGPSRTPRARRQAGYDAVWWPRHLMGWHPDSVWTEDITPLAKLQDNPHVYFDPLVMMGVVGAPTEKHPRRLGRDRPDPRAPGDGRALALTLDHVTQRPRDPRPRAAASR